MTTKEADLSILVVNTESGLNPLKLTSLLLSNLCPGDMKMSKLSMLCKHWLEAPPDFHQEDQEKECTAVQSQIWCRDITMWTEPPLWTLTSLTQVFSEWALRDQDPTQMNSWVSSLKNSTDSSKTSVMRNWTELRISSKWTYWWPWKDRKTD